MSTDSTWAPRRLPGFGKCLSYSQMCLRRIRLEIVGKVRVKWLVEDGKGKPAEEAIYRVQPTV
jgi:hypothetical protein